MCRRRRAPEKSSHTDLVYGLAFSPDGTRLAVGRSMGNHCRSWGLVSFHAMKDGTGVHHEVDSSLGALAWAPDGRWLAAGTSPSGILRVDATTGIAAPLWRDRTGSGASTLAFDRTGSRLAFAVKSGQAQVLTLATKAVVSMSRVGDGDVNGLAFAPDGATLAGVTGQQFYARPGFAKLAPWDPQTGTLRGQLLELLETLMGVVYSPDGVRLYAGHLRGTRLPGPALSAARPDRTGRGSGSRRGDADRPGVSPLSSAV